MHESVVRDQHFKAVAEVKVDSKKRISLPKKVRSKSTSIYKLFVNESGQIILDPQVVIPAAEAWLYENEETLIAVRRGLKDVKEGKLFRGESFAKHAEDEIE